MLVNLFAVFSERDRERRMKAIVANYTEDVIWSDPEATIRGHEGLNEGAQKMLDSTPHLYSSPRVRSAYSAIWATCPSPMECLSSRPDPSATTGAGTRCTDRRAVSPC
jgi:hypothetical protein